VEFCSYAELEERGAGYHTLVHLAVANNDSDLPAITFQEINVDFLLKIAGMARNASIARFINVSSSHALDLDNATAYACSKRDGAAALAQLAGLVSETVYLPMIYGARWSGKLARLNSLPSWLARVAFVPLAALKPTMHCRKLTAYCLAAAPAPEKVPVILFDDQSENPVFSWSKRLIDLTFAVVVAVFLGWLLLLIWVAIQFESPGPGLFAQPRVGRNEKIFTCYKFRTMQHGTKQAGTHEVSEASVTRLGRFMRKTKVDELPQIWNIFCNDISLIGPRPCLPVQQELVEARRARGVFDIKPGISGLAQVNDIDMSEPEKLAYWDARYTALRSIVLDLKITIATATGRGQGDKIKG